jgi:hypothetical protein
VELLKQIALWLVGTVAFDWLFAGRMAALTTVDYRWWPLSKLRLITLTLFATAIALMAYYGLRAEWPLLVSVLAYIVYMAAIMADLDRQRERGPLPHAPPRYSDGDGDY